MPHALIIEKQNNYGLFVGKPYEHGDQQHISSQLRV